MHRPRPAPRPNTLMYAGVFFLFGSLGMLIAMIQPSPGTWSMGLAMAAFSGLVATGWAYAFSSRRFWLLVPLMIAPFVIPPWIFPPLGERGFFSAGAGLSAPARLALLAILIVVGVSIGFTLLIRFVRGSEQIAARSRVELDLAARVHESLVPAIDARSPVARVSAISLPSSEMGGDLVDTLVRDGELDAFIADVSGHGVAAGLVMGMVKSAIHMRLRASSTETELGHLLIDLNRVLSPLLSPGTFATMACVRIRPGSCEYALAGHLPIWLWRASSDTLEELSNDHLPLAIDPAEPYASGRVQLQPGDTLVMITDGLIETAAPDGTHLGLSAMRTALQKLAPLHRGEPDKLINALLATCNTHANGTPPTDDRSVLVVVAG